MKLLVLLLSVFLLASCAKDDKSARQSDGEVKKRVRKIFVPLTPEQQTKLTTPTVYYVPSYEQSEMSCERTKEMKDRESKLILVVCENVFKDCVLQGTCEIRKYGKSFLINVAGKENNERRFHVVDESECRFGNGAVRDTKKAYKKMCIDPYYSIAADLSIYSLGDVIYVPTASGMRLPDGTIHDGHFIVRDTGGGMKGHGRFDFFSGFDSPKLDSNPLSALELNDKATNVPYFIVTGSKATEILKLRNFTLLPVIE